MASDPQIPSSDANVRLALARVWRPRRFGDLIGQEALVRTLTNAIVMGRLAHAYMLTGVRGVGKTTTARIIARAANCIGRDPATDPEPCDVCTHCKAISAGRDIDVIEMDAASHTGVDDIRDVIASAQYSPSAAKYKIHIIDEVHMLSRNAFNALLKTLEEPPKHARFIFATTEIRKVPQTILSRCQRFDLRRVEGDVLAGYLTDIAQREGYNLMAESARLISRAAQGSVRDGLSILDQALASVETEEKIVTAQLVSNMLGLLDGAESLCLLEDCLAGRGAEALAEYDRLIAASHDPVQIIQSLLETTALLTRMRVAGSAPQFNLLPEAEGEAAKALVPKLSGPTLARAWQLLLKGLGDMSKAPDPLEAGAMCLVRLICAANMPEPAEIIRKLSANDTQGAPKSLNEAPDGQTFQNITGSSNALETGLYNQPEVQIFKEHFPGATAIPVKPDSMKRET